MNESSPKSPLDLRLPTRHAASHKGTYGRVLVVAGSRPYAGAAGLAADGASLGGAGLVAVAVPRGIADRVGSRRPSRIVAALREDRAGGLAWSAWPDLAAEVDVADAVVVGPGWGTGWFRDELLARILAAGRGPIVVDADGLNLLARTLDTRERASVPVVLTPHPGEAARLLGVSTSTVQDDRAAAARQLAETFRAVVVLKGAGTIVDDGVRRFRTEVGNPGMATGGTGDVLAGLIGGLLAWREVSGLDEFETAALAVHVHGRAGDLARDRRGMTALRAEDVVWGLADAMREVER